MTEKIILVDDEVNVLESLRRQLRKRFEVSTAESGDEALEKLEDQGPFAVIVSDMRMPGMNGVQLLSKVKNRFPDTVRLMLTGNADQETAAEAVNDGQIFRFLTKPCSSAFLMTSLTQAVQQYNLITAEKELLNKTVKGSITVMAELLSLTNAIAFSSGYRIRPQVKHIVKKLELANQWQYEVAALMSQIGCITMPGDILHKLHKGEELSDEEQKMYENHPKVGSRLISNIPRLGKIAKMIEYQLHPFDLTDETDSQENEAIIGAEILKATIDYDLLRQQDLDHEQTIRRMWKRSEMYNADVLNILEKHKPREAHATVSTLSFKDIIPGMIAGQDVFAKNGTLLIPKDQEFTWSTIQSLMNFEKHIGIIEPIKVIMADRGDQDLLSLEL